MISIPHGPLMRSIKLAMDNKKEVYLTFPIADLYQEDGQPETVTRKFRIYGYDPVSEELKGMFLDMVTPELDQALRPYSIIGIQIAE